MPAAQLRIAPFAAQAAPVPAAWCTRPAEARTLRLCRVLAACPGGPEWCSALACFVHGFANFAGCALHCMLPAGAFIGGLRTSLPCMISSFVLVASALDG